MNLSVMAIGATTGITYAVERMSRSKGGKGGRIITTVTYIQLQKFPPPGSSLDSGGYSIAKFGNVVLTRSFPKMAMKPTPSEDGVKAFALCPFYVPTKLVTDEYKGLSTEESKLRVAREIHKESKGLTRMLVVEEVGEALIHSLKRDADGAAYMIFPDMPIFEVPDPAHLFILCLFAAGKVANALGRESLGAKEVCVILLLLFYIGFYLLHFILMTIISIIF